MVQYTTRTPPDSNSFNPVVTQMSLNKQNKSQNKMESHESVKGIDKNKAHG